MNRLIITMMVSLIIVILKSVFGRIPIYIQQVLHWNHFNIIYILFYHLIKLLMFNMTSRNEVFMISTWNQYALRTDDGAIIQSSTLYEAFNDCLQSFYLV